MGGLVIPLPHVAGQPTTEAQAHVLNQTLAENARNNLRDKIKECGENLAAGQALVDEYLASYEFGKRGGGGFRSSDPVEAQAMDDLRKAITTALVGKGLAKKDIKPSDVTAKAKEILAGPKGENMRKRARKIVKERAESAQELLADL